MNKDVKTPDYVVQWARDLRNDMTDAERILWSRVKNKQVSGYKFRSQHPIGRYILDFYCHEKLLAVEIDGDIHEIKKDYDNYRDEFLKSMGIRTLRFDNREVIQDVELVISRIKAELLLRDLSHVPPLGDRGVLVP
jgi:very-short-patch-repair endonuclease